MMDFHAAMETFAEAWVAANTQTPINTDISPQTEPVRNEISTDPPTMVSVSAEPVNNPSKTGTKQPSLNMVLTPSVGPGGVKSMPIHCIVEQVQPAGGSTDGATGGGGGSGGGGGGGGGSGSSGGVKAEGGSPKKNNLSNGSSNNDNVVIEMDTYAILPGTTMFSELVRTALIKIGYTASESMGAKGAIQIKNWKPLSFDTITDNPNCTLDEILGDLTSVATLRIRLCRSVGLKFLKFGVSHEQLQAFRSLDISEESNIQWTDEMVRCAVVDLLNEMNQSTLAKLSPLSQSTISNIANSKYMAKIGPEKCNDFGRWYTDYKKNGPEIRVSDADKKSPDGIRLTFHPIYELPKMRSWFNMYLNPNDALFESLVQELNSDNVRKQRKPITVKKLKIWWRNEKARQKRILGRIERGEEILKRKGRRKKKNEQDNAGERSQHQRDIFHDTVPSSLCQHRGADENTMRQERSPSTGSPCGQGLSPIQANVSSPMPATTSNQRPFITIDRNVFQQTPVYPVPYVPLGSSSTHENGAPRTSHLDMISPHSPQQASRYFTNARDDDLSKLMLPPKEQHPVYHHHHQHHQHNNSAYGN